MYINGTIASYNEHSGTRSHATILRVSSLIACSFGRWNNRKNSATKRDAAPLLLPSSFCMYKRRIFRARERVGRRYAAAAYRRINQNYYEAISAAATGRIKRRPPPSMINHFSRSIVSRWIIIIIGRFSIVEREGISAFENIKLDER